MATTGVFKEVEVQWASVHEVNTMSNAYELEVHNLTPEQEKFINSFIQGKKSWTEVRTSDKYPEKGRFVKFKSNKPPKVIDGYKNPISPDVKIGNGSVCNIQFIVSDASWKGESRVKLTLLTVQVLKLNQYTQDDLPVVKGEYAAESTLEEVD